MLEELSWIIQWRDGQQNYSRYNLQFDLIQKAPRLFTFTFMHLADIYMCFLGIEPMTFVLLTQCSTTEPQLNYVKKVVIFLEKSW